MRVLHSCRTYFPDPPGGLQEAIRQISGSTRDRGFDPIVFALSKTPEPKTITFPESDVVRQRSWMAPASTDLGGPTAFRDYRRLARTADVLHYHFPWPFSDLLHLAGGRDKASVMTYHSDIVRQRVLGRFYEPLMWRTLRSMDAIVATSEAYATSSPVLSHPSIRPKVRVIPLGIDKSRYTMEADTGVFERIGLHRDRPYFAFVGVLRYYKGLEYLVRAARAVDAQVVIAGMGPEEPRLRELMHSLGVTNVLLAGQVSDAERAALLEHCEAFVFPSYLRSEAFGMSLVEAAMHSRPMISCEISTGTSYVNQHDETGLVVLPESSDELAHAMQQFLGDDSLADQMGRQARLRYEKLFSGPALGEEYAALYGEILEQ